MSSGFEFQAASYVHMPVELLESLYSMRKNIFQTGLNGMFVSVIHSSSMSTTMPMRRTWSVAGTAFHWPDYG